MGRPKKSDKSKEKPSQVGDAGQEGAGVEDQAVVRTVVLTDSNGGENADNAEAGSSGLQRKSHSDTDSVTDSSVDNARKRL